VPDSAASLFSTIVATFMVIVALNFWAVIFWKKLLLLCQHSSCKATSKTLNNV
jgi:hypothetical protein